MNKPIIILVGVFAWSATTILAQEINVTPTGVEVGAAGSSASGALMQQSGQTTSFVTKDGVNSPTVRMVIKPDGKVGIGTTAPAATLDVKGTFTARDSSGNAKLITAGNVIVVADTVADSEFAMKIERSGWIGFCGYLTNGAYGELSQNGDKGLFFSNGPIDTGSLVIDPWNSASAGIKIKSNGYIGINTNSTPERLTVNGKVKSKGFITDTSNWSDYIFHKEYKLPTLTEVERHITEKGHLPGMPSEKEVIAYGVDLGDMQVRLLAQIEQLTLHMIAHQKAIDALQQENASLKRELKSVTKSE